MNSVICEVREVGFRTQAEKKKHARKLFQRLDLRGGWKYVWKVNFL